MIHVDLFSGIGCFAYAARQVWSDHRVACFTEIDPFCRRILGKHFPGVPIVEDVNDLESIVAHAKSAKTVSAEQGRLHPEPCVQNTRIDILTGGPPCQPASAAGLRRGQEDVRWLWPQTIKVIAALKPRWILLENPTGITSLAESIRKPQVESKVLRRGKVTDLYEAVLTQQEALLLGSIIKDLKDLGYQFPEACDGTPILPVVPACAVGAPHRRDRVWIVCHRNVEHSGISPKDTFPKKSDNQWALSPCQSDSHAQNPQGQRCGPRGAEPAGQQRNSGADGSDCDASDSERGRSEQGHQATRGLFHESWRGCGDAADTGLQGPQKREMQSSDRREEQSTTLGDPWDEHWLETATRLCRVDDGTAGGLYRTARLKALGNAIVWQVAAQIMSAMKAVDEARKNP